MEGEARNITPTIAYFIGAALAEQLAKRFGVPTTSLRVSVSPRNQLFVSASSIKGNSCQPAACMWQLRRLLHARMQIGRDPRVSGPVLAASLAAGLTGKGVHVARFGIATTPAMFMSTITEGKAVEQKPWNACHC